MGGRVPSGDSGGLLRLLVGRFESRAKLERMAEEPQSTGPNLATDSPRPAELPATLQDEIGDIETSTALIMMRLASLSRQVQEVYHAALRSLGMSYSEYAVLHTLVLAGAPYRLSPTRINDRLGLSSGGMTKTVDRLESARLVQRMPDPSDGRGVLVELTETGKKKANWIFRNGLTEYARRLEHLTPDDRSRLAEDLGILLQSIEGLGEG